MSQHETGRREKLFELNAVPAKQILKNKARVCPPISAVCEILDNIFDNFDENGAHHDLSISFVVRTEGKRSEISLVENSGGIRRDKLQPLVQLGAAYHGGKGSIGTWGEGFKVAAFSLGSEVEISTLYPGEKPVSVHFYPGWLDAQDWTVPVYAVKENVPRTGTTVLTIRNLERKVDWSEIMREVGVIYGHKVQTYQESGRKIRLDFDIDGSSATVKPRDLGSTENIRDRFAFPPDFSPREFATDWNGQNGSVRCRLVVGLTPRHSGETSGVYMYGNGRMFARALRTRVVGYGESGNSILRDHPSCWRIHAYAFFEADDGADIPWQAPLKDGVSENHPIATRFREFFKEVVAPYARFAKAAKASELVPYTVEWSEMAPTQRAEVLFGKGEANGPERLRALPKGIQEFVPPDEMEMLRFDGVAGQRMLTQLEEHAKYARHVIGKRDAAGYELQEEVLRALNPKAFAEMSPTRKADVRQPKQIRTTPTARVTVQLRSKHLARLRELFEIDDDRGAITAAVRFALKKLRKRK